MQAGVDCGVPAQTCPPAAPSVRKVEGKRYLRWPSPGPGAAAKRSVQGQGPHGQHHGHPGQYAEALAQMGKMPRLGSHAPGDHGRAVGWGRLSGPTDILAMTAQSVKSLRRVGIGAGRILSSPARAWDNGPEFLLGYRGNPGRGRNNFRGRRLWGGNQRGPRTVQRVV